MIKGKKLVGYHLLQKLREFHIIDMVDRSLPSGEDALYELSHIFDANRGVQVPMDSLCSRYLNMKYSKKKNQPHALSEARVGMALFHKWAAREGIKIEGCQASVPAEESKPTVVSMKGKELQVLIKECVAKSIKKNLQKMSENLYTTY